MKRLKLIGLVPVMLCGLLSHGVYAADAVTINVTGNIVASPCTVDPDSVTKSVPLGDIQAASMNEAGSGSEWVDFDIKLINCPAGTTSVTATFSGTADTDSPADSYANTGTATKVAVQLETSDTEEPLGNGKTSDVDVSSDKTATWGLQTRAFSTAGSVTPGTIASVISVNFTYK